MSGLSRRLKQLDEALLALGEETMLLEELDGFIAGLLVCPELIKPGDWLPIVWNKDSADQQPVFEDLDHVNRVLGLVMEHYNDVARTLMRSTSVTTTCSGNCGSRASRRPSRYARRPWKTFLEADVDTVAAMSGMLMLAAIARGEEEVTGRDTASATAPDRIADWVVILNEWRLANHRPMQSIDPRGASASRKKVGRNDPCLCGSGKKYKKCCGLN